MTGEHDYKYALAFTFVAIDLNLYLENKKPVRHLHSFDTAMNYLHNKICIERFLRDNLMHDLKNIKGVESGAAQDDSADFDKIMPEKYRSLQCIDKQIQTLEKVLEEKAEKDEAEEASEFFTALKDGYYQFVNEDRYNIFEGAGALAYA